MNGHAAPVEFDGRGVLEDPGMPGNEFIQIGLGGFALFLQRLDPDADIGQGVSLGEQPDISSRSDGVPVVQINRLLIRVADSGHLVLETAHEILQPVDGFQTGRLGDHGIHPVRGDDDLGHDFLPSAHLFDDHALDPTGVLDHV